MFSNKTLNKLITACEKTWEAYSALNVAKNEPLFHTANSAEPRTLEDIISASIQKNIFSLDIKQGSDTFSLQIKPRIKKGKTLNSQYNIVLKSHFVQQPSVFKSPVDCTLPEKLQWLSNQQLTCRLDKKSGRFNLGVRLRDSHNKVIHLGGPGKIDLYPEHLETLLNIRKHIQQNEMESIPSMLIAMATGSGKTFVQVLWFIVLRIANIPGIFALPDKLIKQFKQDFSRLLSNALVNTIEVIEDSTSEADARRIIHQITKPNAKKSHYCIASADRLLDDTYIFQTLAGTKEIFQSFDEQHLIVNHELRKLRLYELAKSNLTMFLTATPTEETYRLCGSKPVVYLSSRQKEKAQHGKFPHLTRIASEKISDKMASLPSNSLTLTEKVGMSVIDMFEDQKESPVVTLLEKFQYEEEAVWTTSSDTINRWNYQPPSSRKMLALVDNNEELINISRFVNHTDEYGDFNFKINFINKWPPKIKSNQFYILKISNKWTVHISNFKEWAELTVTDEMESLLHSHEHSWTVEKEKQLGKLLSEQLKVLDPDGIYHAKEFPVYANGNAESRSILYANFLLAKEDADKKISNLHRERKKQSRQKGLESVSLSDQLDNTLFSGIVDYIICDMLGLSLIELNVKRKQNPAAVKAEFDAQFQKLLQAHKLEDPKYFKLEALGPVYFNKLLYPQNPRGIDEAGARQISTLIYSILGYYRARPAKQDAFIENWTLTNPFRRGVLRTFRARFQDYAVDHRMLFVMSGMEKAETPVLDNRVFSGFNEEWRPIHNKNGAVASDAKKRSRTLIEEFSPHSEELHCTPRYCVGIDETIADNYFKLGFTGLYVSNKKTEGFNDPNLHTVIVSVPGLDDSNNNPDKAIQGAGRTRSLDPTQNPYHFIATKSGLSLAFDLENLNKDGDYYPKYFAAQKALHFKGLQAIGNDIATEIQRFLDTTAGKADELLAGEFDDAVRLIILQAFRKINNNNDHKISQSKKHLRVALGFASQALEEQVEKYKQPYQISSFNAAIGSLIYGAQRINYWASSKNTLAALQAFKGKSEIERLYTQIIQSNNFHDLSEQTGTYGEFSALLDKKMNIAQYRIKCSVISQFSAEEKQNINDTCKKTLLPMLVKFIDPQKQDFCMEQALQFNHWHAVFFLEEELFKTCENGSPEAYATVAIELFRKVPSLRHFLSAKDTFTALEEDAKEAHESISQAALKTIEHGLVCDLADYLGKGFLLQMRHLLVSRDYELVYGILSDSDNAYQFALYLLDNQETLKTVEEGIAGFMQFFKPQYPEVKTIRSLTTQAQSGIAQLKTAVDDLKEKISADPAGCFEASMKTFTADLLRESEKKALQKLAEDSVLPALLKQFTPADQKRIALQLKNYPHWHRIFFSVADSPYLTDKSDFTNPETLKTLTQEILKSTGKFDALPSCRDYKKTAENAAKTLQKKIPLLILESLPAMGMNKFMRIFTTETAISTPLADYLATQFIADIEPLFLDMDLRILQDFMETPEVNRAFSSYIIDKLSAQVMAEKSLEKDPLSLLYDFFKIYENGRFYPIISTVKLVPEKMANTFEQIKSKSSDYRADLSRENAPDLTFFVKHPREEAASLTHLKKAHKDPINSLVKEDLLALIYCVVDDKNCEQVTAACLAFNEWPAFLMQHQKTLDSLDENKLHEQLLPIINALPTLKTKLNPNNMVNLQRTAETISETFKQIARIKSPFNAQSVYFLKDYFSSETFFDALRPFFLYTDWTILKSLFKNEDKLEEFVEALLAVIGKNKTLQLSDILPLLKAVYGKDPYYNHLNLNEQQEIKMLGDFADKDFLSEKQQQFRDSFANAYADVLKAKPAFINAIGKNALLPVFEMPWFEEMVASILGDFDKDQIRRLIKIASPQDKNNATSLAESILEFKTLIKAKNYDQIYQKFIQTAFNQYIQANIDGKEQSLSTVPMVKIFELLLIILNEQLSCHNYFNDLEVKADSGKLVQALPQAISKIRVSGVQNCFGMFKANAMKNAMFKNSEISAQTHQRKIASLEFANRNILKPVMDTMDGDYANSIVLKTQSPIERKTYKKAVTLGQQINLLTPLTAEQLDGAYSSEDAISPLINKITQARHPEDLFSWWADLIQTDQFIWNHIATPRALQDFSKAIVITNQTDNKALSQLQAKTKAFREDWTNIILWDQVAVVKLLSDKLYTIMVKNNAASNPQVFKDWVDAISDKAGSVKWQSSTMQSIQKVVNNDKLPVATKILAIQKLAKAYSEDSLHNASRAFSHFFSDAKKKEAKEVAHFCKVMSNMDFTAENLVIQSVYRP